ncbi:hypothetical protein ACVWZL_000450 [Bradyrhizobium sp. GM2.4]
MTEMTIAEIAYVHSFVRLRRGPFFRPGHPSRSRRAQGRSRLAAFAATARLGLDRPEHGGMLAWNGTAFLAGTCRQAGLSLVGGRPRGEAWRIGCKRHQAALFCLAELRRPRAGFWPPWFPLPHQALVALLRLCGNQHLAVAQYLDVVGIRWPTPAAFLLRMSGLKLHRAGLDGDQCRARPQVILALRQQMPSKHGELPGHGHRGDLMAARNRRKPLRPRRPFVSAGIDQGRTAHFCRIHYCLVAR